MKSKLPEVGTTIFTVMSKMAKEEGAINLSQGFPDFPINQNLQALVTEAMDRGFVQYAPMPGLPLLVDSIVSYLSSEYLWDGNPANVTVTAGATEALFCFISAFVHPGDEVIILEPAYDSYIPAIRLNKGIPIPVALDANAGFSVPWDEVFDKVNLKTRLLIINSPHNPTGSVLTNEDLLSLQKLVESHPNLLILSDEVYDRIIFDGMPHESVLKYEALRNRSAAVFSFGKTFHATGWKVGYIVAPEAITREIRKVHQFVNFSVNSSMQWAIATYMNNPANYQSLHSFFEAKRDHFLETIRASRFTPLKSRGTYFQLLSYQNISNAPDAEMAEQMTRVNKIASIPISPFYSGHPNHRLLRFCFAKSNETLDKAGEILCNI